MVAPYDEHSNPGLIQPLQLSGEKESGLHRRLIAIVEIAGDHQSINLFVEAKIDGLLEGEAGRATN